MKRAFYYISIASYWCFILVIVLSHTFKEYLENWHLLLEAIFCISTLVASWLFRKYADIPKDSGFLLYHPVIKAVRIVMYGYLACYIMFGDNFHPYSTYIMYLIMGIGVGCHLVRYIMINMMSDA